MAIECVYLIRSGINYKIGRTKNLANRLRAIQTGSPYPIVLLYAEYTESASTIEAEIHQFFKEQRLMGEWFSIAEYVGSAQQAITELCGEEYIGQFDAGDPQVWALYEDGYGLAVRYRDGLEPWPYEPDSY
jgi:hypothetical protein